VGGAPESNNWKYWQAPTPKKIFEATGTQIPTYSKWSNAFRNLKKFQCGMKNAPGSGALKNPFPE
jgi:hypothetical protein